MKKKDVLCERIVVLFETYMIYLNPGISLLDLAKFFEVEEAYLEKYFKEEVEYTFDEMLSVFRITHATDLLTKELIPYEELWKGSGFNSHVEFEKAFKKLAITRIIV